MKEKIYKLLEDNGIELSNAQEMLRKIFSEKKLKGVEKKNIETFIEILKKNEIPSQDIAKILLPFADPTFDTTFKMLFGSKEHDQILISLLNNLLNLSDDKEIKELEIITEKLETPIFSYEKGESSVTGAVDVLCTTTSGQKIAVEMQRAKQPYFLARTQHYMSKLISVQVNEKSGKEYHKEILDTYILVLEKQNLFTGQHELLDNSLYEIEVEPVVKQTQEVFPGNKMHWKFFELTKFKEHDDYKNLNKDSNLKHQWLEFLIDCGNQLDEPDRHELIKQGYDIMKMMKWEGDKQVLYWKEQMREFDAQENQKELILEAKNQGILEGKIKGEVKSDIGKIKMGIKYKINQEEIKSDLTLLGKKRAPTTNIDDLFKYMQDHMGDTDSQICDDLDLMKDIDFGADFVNI